MAQVLHRWGGELAYEPFPDPEPGPGEVLVRVEACGVGLTVLNYIQGQLGQRPEDLPRIPGHEAVGVVVRAGPGAEGLFSPGQRVMAYFYLTCGACDFCRLAHEPLCRRFRGYVGVATHGGYAEYMVLPAANWLAVPEGIAPEQATAIPDAIATPFHVSRRAAIGPGDRVLVVGAGGGVGIHMVQMASVFGGRVVGVDLGEAKLRAVEQAGAAGAVDFGDGGDEAVQHVRRAAGGAPTVAVDFVGSPQTLEFCLRCLDRRGRLVAVTTFPGVAVPVEPRRLVFDELTVLGSRYASRWEVVQAAQLVADGRIRPVVSQVEPLSRAPVLFQRLRARQLIGRGAVVPEQG